MGHLFLYLCTLVKWSYRRRETNIHNQHSEQNGCAHWTCDISCVLLTNHFKLWHIMMVDMNKWQHLNAFESVVARLAKTNPRENVRTKSKIKTVSIQYRAENRRKKWLNEKKQQQKNTMASKLCCDLHENELHTHVPNNEVHITNCDQINHETFSECTNSHKSTRTIINRIRHVVFENKIIKMNEFNELQPLTFTWAVWLVRLSFLLLHFFLLLYLSLSVAASHFYLIHA